MNLTVNHNNRRNHPVIGEAFTRFKKPRCQMFLSGEWGYWSQCQRPAVAFEPHHDKPWKYGKVQRTKTYNGAFLYGEDVLFGYCKQHSMAENHRLIEAEEEATRVRVARETMEMNRKNRRRKMFDTMIAAIDDGDIDGIYTAFNALVDDGVRLRNIRVDERYL